MFPPTLRKAPRPEGQVPAGGNLSFANRADDPIPEVAGTVRRPLAEGPHAMPDMTPLAHRFYLNEIEARARNDLPLSLRSLRWPVQLAVAALAVGNLMAVLLG